MLMAAGLGNRLRPFTDRMPKPLLPLMGIPMAQFGVDLLVQAGVKKIVANIHHLPEQAERGLRALDLQGAAIEISDESTELLGSAGGIRKALPQLGDAPFFLLNSDVLCDVDLHLLALRHQQLRQKYGVTVTLTIFPAGPKGGKYREIKLDYAKGLIRGLGEPEEGKPFFVGMAVIEPEALALVPDNGPAEFVPTILAPAIEAGKAGAYLASGEWHDIGSPELWLKAHLSLMKKLEEKGVPEPWKKLIHQISEKRGPNFWVAKNGILGMPAKNLAPAYLGGGSNLASLSEVGPSTVIYGTCEGMPRSGSVIGYDGLWYEAELTS